MNKLHNKKGMTLVEVLISVALLALVLAGALGMVQTGVFISVQSTNAMIADVTAQQLVEELVGRTGSEIVSFLEKLDNDDKGDIIVKTPTKIKFEGTTSDGICYEIEVEFNHKGFTDLAHVTVEITGNGHTLEAILNIGEGS